MALTIVESAGTGLLFSVISLYMVTVILVTWYPEEIMVGADMARESRRLSSAIIANSTMLGIAGLVSCARVCSYLGDKLVDLVVELDDTADVSGPGEGPRSRIVRTIPQFGYNMNFEWQGPCK